MADLELTLLDRGAMQTIAGMKITPAKWRIAAKHIHRNMKIRVDSMFVKNKKGGKHRGQRWEFFAPQYTRKTDGVTVPAWGGVKKVRGKGKVKGRLRPGTNTRLHPNSSLMQDTNTLRGKALQSRRITRTKVVMGSAGPEYSRFQHKMRPFVFWHLPDDLSMMRKVAVKAALFKIR
jgi:hypothetical protein